MDKNTLLHHQTMDELNNFMVRPFLSLDASLCALTDTYPVPRALRFSVDLNAWLLNLPLPSSRPLQAEKRFPSEVRARLREYFTNAQHLMRERDYSRLLSQMSPALRGEVALLSNGPWLAKVSYFCDMADDFVVQIALAMVPAVYAPEEWIDVTDLHVIVKGVGVQGFKVMMQGGVWGDDMILNNRQLRNLTPARALTYLHVSKLPRMAFIRITSYFPKEAKIIRKAQLKLAMRRWVVLRARALAAAGQFVWMYKSKNGHTDAPGLGTTSSRRQSRMESFSKKENALFQLDSDEKALQFSRPVSTMPNSTMGFDEETLSRLTGLESTLAVLSTEMKKKEKQVIRLRRQQRKLSHGSHHTQRMLAALANSMNVNVQPPSESESSDDDEEGTKEGTTKKRRKHYAAASPPNPNPEGEPLAPSPMMESIPSPSPQRKSFLDEPSPEFMRRLSLGGPQDKNVRPDSRSVNSRQAIETLPGSVLNHGGAFTNVVMQAAARNAHNRSRRNSVERIQPLPLKRRSSITDFFGGGTACVPGTFGH